MILRTLEVKDYLSIESAKLDRLGKFNVLIGRNNSGKSAVISSLKSLSSLMRGEPPADFERRLRGHDAAKSLELTLTFELADAERRAIFAMNEGLAEEINAALIQSPFLRKAEFYFRSFPGKPQSLNLNRTRIMAEDAQWAIVQQKQKPEESSFNFMSSFRRMSWSIERRSVTKLDAEEVGIGQGGEYLEARLEPSGLIGRITEDPQTNYLFNRLSRYFQSAFFFDPFRHSSPRLAAKASLTLNQDGSNLAQVLHTTISNNRERFDEIEAFVHAALPDIGKLQTPLVLENQTEIQFRSPHGDYQVRLHEMGGGIEQLLMAATVLVTTDDESSLFIEEPESHLHPGAQRFLIERLTNGQRQVFVTTHSPLFINSAHSRRIYRVRQGDGKTLVSQVDDTLGLSAVLDDIGARNSDLLLSDGVLFVEGPGDKDALQAWSETLGRSLAEHNITVLVMGGGEYADRKAPVRGEVLAGISKRAPIPHQFVFDRDERGEPELHSLQKSLGDRCHVLGRRELENYLVCPRAIKAALTKKYSVSAKDAGITAVLEKVGATSDEQIGEVAARAATDLYGVVLLKRIRAALGGLAEGMLPRQLCEELVGSTSGPDLPALVEQKVTERLHGHVSQMKMREAVERERHILDEQWAHKERRPLISPGEEILGAIFKSLGDMYTKSDAARIAKEMTATEIDDEIKELIQAITTVNRRFS